MIFELPDDIEDIKKYCKKCIKTKNTTQTALSNKLGYTQQNISYVLNEKTTLQYTVFEIFLELGYDINLFSNKIMIDDGEVM